MNYYHGGKKRGPYFEGWYLKHQTKDGKALALIPAFHIDGTGRRSVSLQVIADNASWWLEYPDTGFHAAEMLFQIRMEQGLFNARGVWLNVEENGLCLHGNLRYGPFTPLRSDIMGPFRFFAGMECAHGVLSMGHTLDGTLTLNGQVLDFSGGTGYLETDRGRAFPSAYLWTQCSWQEPEHVSLMLAIASIPLPVGSFTGCICALIDQGREYRLATYRGARVERWSAAGAVIRQGNYRLEVEVLETQALPLRAPIGGGMGRIIHESLRATLRYRFWSGGALLLDHTDPCASFEYVEERSHHAESTTT